MILVMGTVRLPPENLARARDVMARMVVASRAEDGCSGYSYAEDVLEPGLIRVTEIWRDQAALDRHFAMPHLAEWRAAWPDLGLGERRLTRHEIGPAQPT